MARLRVAHSLLAAALLAALLGCNLALAAPLKKPTARRGECFDLMKGEIAAADKKPANKGYGVLFYGDSIFESLRGTDKCRSCDNIYSRSSCKGVPDVLKKYFGRMNPGVMSMSMDQTANLLWRLDNGQIPAKNKPRVAVLHIGTNDFTNCAWGAKNQRQKEAALNKELPGILGRIKDAVALMRKGMPNARVVVLGILPRGTGSGKGGPAEANSVDWPSHYAKATAALNKELGKFASTDKKHLSFVDCGGVFLGRNGKGIQRALMTDAVHPTKAGWEALAKCLAPVVEAAYKG